MGSAIRMPKLGLTMTEGIVAQWLVAPGQRFEKGQTILVIETDKISNEIEAEEEGSIGRIVVKEGDTASVGAVLAHVGDDGGQGDDGVKTLEPQLGTPLPASAMMPTTSTDRRINATPLARRLARQAGVDLASLKGSGPNGRIKAADVKAPPSVEAPAPKTSFKEAIPAATQLNGAQQRIAAVMTAAKREVPHFYLATEVNVDAALEIRERAKRNGLRLTLTHFLLLAMAYALRSQPHANRCFTSDGIVSFETVDIGLAVNTPAGLVAPILKDIGGFGLASIASRADGLVTRARNNELKVDDMNGGATSLSNAGMHDVTHMSSIIRPGHSSILGAGSIRQVFRPDANGAPVLRNEVGLVLSCDHRLLDGASGLSFLNAIKGLIENPLDALLY